MKKQKYLKIKDLLVINYLKSKKVQNDISYLPFTIKGDKFAGNPKDIIKEKNELKHIFLKNFF